jgi:dienelactone hydrolase
MGSLSRRGFLRSVIGVPFLAAADDKRYPGVVYRNYPKCLPDYLRGLAAAAYEKRSTALAKLVSAEAVQQRQRMVRKTLIDLIGGLPDKTPLNPQVTGRFEREGYKVERLVYESRPQLFVSANLYIPTAGRPPYPGVLFQLGHSWNGKAWDSYQRACQGLARLGFLVLAFDPMGQGERIYYPDDTGLRTRLKDGPDGEHTHPGRQMLLAGWTCTQLQLWDAMRSLEYLASHPQVDHTKLASTGQSGGATLTMLLCAVDDRLKTAAVFSGNTENIACPDFLPPGSTDDAEQNLVGSGPLGIDRWDLFYPFAPKPMLISISDKDYFGTYSPNYVKNSWHEYQRLSAVYRVLGAESALQWADTPLPHGLSYDSRLELYNWMLARLKGDSQPIREEPPTKVEADTDLRVSKTGNLTRSIGGATPFLLNRERVTSLRRAEKPAPLRDLLRLEAPRSAARPVSLRKVRSLGEVEIEALDIPSAPGVYLPAWCFRPKVGTVMTALLLLHPAGRNAVWKEDELAQQLALAGIPVLAADVRGVGDLRPEFSAGAPGYQGAHEAEEDYAWGSLILGRPLVGQRVTDIIAAARGLRSVAGAGVKIAVAALGTMAVPALVAGALENGIDRIYLAGGLSSYRSIVDTEMYRHSLADFIPGILAHTDLPEIAATLSPRRLVIAGPVDAAAAALAPRDARAVYDSALRQSNFELRDKAAWSAETLEEFCKEG